MLTWAIAWMIVSIFREAVEKNEDSSIVTNIGCLFILSIPADVMIAWLIITVIRG